MSLKETNQYLKDESLMRLDRKYELRIGNIFRRELGLERRREMIEGERKNRWYISEKKLKELQTEQYRKIKIVVDEALAEYEKGKKLLAVTPPEKGEEG